VLLVELQISTGALLTESALYMSMALSRFREARGVLDLALRVQRVPTGQGSQGSTTNGGLQRRLSHGLAHTTLTAGKVSRYCGEYHMSHAYLAKALALHGTRDHASADVAATLHEMGVLMIKRGLWSDAQRLLNESLVMKRALSTRNSGGSGGSGSGGSGGTNTENRFSEEAATLHQLAVVAMNSKPRRLNEAETLLREALVVMQPGPFGVGGRAATLQKLAQVLERRGKSEDAEYYLKEALRLYQTTYGEDVPHVNVAAVLRNLGEHAFGCKKYDTAKTFLTASLNMRKKLYGNSEGKHW